MWLQLKVEHKLKVVHALANGECGGTYIDASILLASIISGMAAGLWPGEGIDRKRFVELWAQHGDQALLQNSISLPLLINRLREVQDHQNADLLEVSRPHSFGLGFGSRILTGQDVDMSDDQVAEICSSVRISVIREYSYGNIFYRQVRSPLIHEYELGNNVSDFAMTSESASVSYGNFINSVNEGWNISRKIHFSIDWLSKLAKSIAARLDTDSDLQPIPKPPEWWIDGGLSDSQSAQ